MKATVVGATGHIGSYLVPKLVNAGWQVSAISRGGQARYLNDPAWRKVNNYSLDRIELESQGKFGDKIAALDADVVIDLICFSQASAEQLFTAVNGRASQLLHCGSIWVYGANDGRPHTEASPRLYIDDYGRGKAEAESYLLGASNERTSTCVLHPGHLVGDGWTPLNPAGNFNSQLFGQFRQGDLVCLPGDGSNTLHHVHCDDVAQAFMRALREPELAAGQSFNAVADSSMSLREYASALVSHFETAADVHFVPLKKWQQSVSDDDYAASAEHLQYNSNASNKKARDVLNFQPRYSAQQAVLSVL